MVAERIRSKEEFYQLAGRGWFGNQLPSLRPEEFLAARWPPETRFCLRSLDPGWSGVAYRLTRGQVLERLKAIPQHRWRRHVVNPMAPDERLLLQGELMRTHRGWSLFYNRRPGLSMREAMAGMRQLEGLAARFLVRQAMDDPSWEFLNEVLARHPDAVVEFTCYDVRLGTLGWNTVFWEVRNY